MKKEKFKDFYEIHMVEKDPNIANSSIWKFISDTT